jgi:hypothetical protein
LTEQARELPIRGVTPPVAGLVEVHLHLVRFQVDEVAGAAAIDAVDPDPAGIERSARSNQGASSL